LLARILLVIRFQTRLRSMLRPLSLLRLRWHSSRPMGHPPACSLSVVHLVCFLRRYSPDFPGQFLLGVSGEHSFLQRGLGGVLWISNFHRVETCEGRHLQSFFLLMFRPLLVNERGSVVRSFGVWNALMWFSNCPSFRALMRGDLWIETILFGVYQGEA
jgi:hypothetical protein